jgi:hypothetical protein
MEGGSCFVQLGPQPQDDVLLTGERDKSVPFSTYLTTNQPLDMPIERFLASVRFEHRSKLDQLGINISSLDARNRG